MRTARLLALLVLTPISSCGGDGGATQADLAVALDLGREDLSAPADLSTPTDLSTPPDLEPPADLAVPPDLRRPPDLVAAAKAPICDKIGSKSEGWYAADGSLICWVQCSGAVAQCLYVGTRSEGWYASRAGAGCMGMDLIAWAKCG